MSIFITHTLFTIVSARWLATFSSLESLCICSSWMCFIDMLAGLLFLQPCPCNWDVPFSLTRRSPIPPNCTLASTPSNKHPLCSIVRLAFPFFCSDEFVWAILSLEWPPTWGGPCAVQFKWRTLWKATHAGWSFSCILWDARKKGGKTGF